MSKIQGIEISEDEEQMARDMGIDDDEIEEDIFCQKCGKLICNTIVESNGYEICSTCFDERN